MNIPWKRKKTLSADVIALLAQAHSIHRAELEFTKDEIRAELRQKVRDAMMRDDLGDNLSGPWAVDRIRIDVGLLFADTEEQREEWVAYVKRHRVAAQDTAYQLEAQKIDKAIGYKRAGFRGAVQPPPYQPGERGTHASGGVVASW